MLKKSLIATLLLSCAANAFALTPREGSYNCTFCDGLLTLKKVKDNTYKVWLGIGMGSCGGEVMIKNKVLPFDQNGVAKYPWKNGAKRCETTIKITAKGAEIEDSCSENSDSTCLADGDYKFSQ